MNHLAHVPTDEEIAKVMAATKMGRMQAINHIRQRKHLADVARGSAR